jgi:hypothetical protein
MYTDVTASNTSHTLCCNSIKSILLVLATPWCLAVGGGERERERVDQHAMARNRDGGVPGAAGCFGTDPADHTGCPKPPAGDVLFSLDFFHSAGACVTQLSDNTAYSSLLVVNDDDTQVDVLYTKTTHTPITFATTTSNILCMSDMKNLSTVYSIANKMLYLDNLPPHMRRTSPISFQCQSGFAGCVSDGGRFAMTFTAVSHTFPLLYHNCTQLDIDMNGHVVTVVCGATVEYNNAPYPSVVFTDVPMPVLSVVQLEFGCTYDTVLGVMTMWPVLHKQAPVYGDIIITIIAILFLAAWLKWVDGLSAAVKQLYTTIDTQKFALTSNNTLANVQGNIAKHALLIENVLCMIVFTKGLEVLTDHPFFTPFNDPFGLSASSLETHVSVLVGGEVLLCLLALFLLSIIYVRATPRYDRQQPPDYTSRWSSALCCPSPHIPWWG